MNTIITGDCLAEMRNLPGHSINCVITDLPYGTTACKWDSVIPFPDLWDAWRRLLKPGGAVITTASQPFTSAMVMSNPKWFRHEWVWIKNRGSNFANTVREPMKEHESVLVFSAGRWTYNKQMQERTGGGADRVKYPIKGNTTESPNYGKLAVGHELNCGAMRVPSSWQKFNCEVGLHPTQKPLALFRYLVRTYTNPGDVVLDPCCGSGTTCLAAALEGRNYIGIEREVKYADIARQRILDSLTPDVLISPHEL